MSANAKKLIDRIGCGGGKSWSDATALETGEMVCVGGLRLSRAVYEDCRGSVRVIRTLATAAAADGPGRPPRRVRILAPIRGKGGTRAAVVELVARSRGAWVEVREEGEC